MLVFDLSTAEHKFDRLTMRNDDKSDDMLFKRHVYSIIPSYLHQSSSSSDDDYDIIKKITRAFRNVTSFPLKKILFQFWAPLITSNGRHLLSCKDYHYALVCLNRSHNTYRRCSVNCQYSIDDVDKVGVEVKRNPNPTIITGGLPARAFLNHFPDVVVDLRAHQGKGNPLVDLALECGFTCSMLLPVFYQNSSNCVGVVECSMKRVGLSIYHLQGSWPYQAISAGLKAATNEIQKALYYVCESHDIVLGQVWIPYESESHHHMPVSSSSTEAMKRMFLLKLTGYGVYSSEDPLSSLITDFYDNCDVVPLKTFEAFQPQFCRNINSLNSDNEDGVLAILSANTKCGCLVICLRSTYTEGDDIDYVFEFFWPRSRDPFILLERLLFNLKRCLPSFKFASGAQLDYEICVVEVTRSGIGSFKILQGNKLSPTSHVMEETRTLVQGVKRKFSDLNQPNQEQLINIYTKSDDDDVDDDDDEVIVAYYRLDCALILLPKHSSTLENAMKKIFQELELDPSQTYNLRVEADEGEWFELNGDVEASFKDVVEYRRNTGKTHSKLLLWKESCLHAQQFLRRPPKFINQ